MRAEHLLDARGICLHVGTQTILDEVDLHIGRSQIITVIGPNGAGKTSLIRILLGFIEPDAGVVEKRHGLRIAYVPQKVVIPDQMPMRVRDFLQLSGRYELEDIRHCLGDLKVSEIMERPVQSISGGELQRVLLAKALMKNPDLLVLDEPAQGLDVNGQRSLYRRIKTIRDQFQCAVLMVSHDLHLVMAATDEVICLNSHVCCNGHPDHIESHPEYLKLFGQTAEELAIYKHHHDHEHDVHGDIIGGGHSHGDHSGCSHD